MWDTISDSLDQFGASSVVDILFIAVLIYLGLLLLKIGRASCRERV